jgi:thioredoxin
MKRDLTKSFIALSLICISLSARVEEINQSSTKYKSDAQVRKLYKDALEHEGITVVKFSAAWCGPCKAYAPVFEKVSEDLPEVTVNGKTTKVKYIALDTDAAKAIAEDNGIRSIPTTIFYKNGHKVSSKTGSLSKDVLKSSIEETAK